MSRPKTLFDPPPHLVPVRDTSVLGVRLFGYLTFAHPSEHDENVICTIRIKPIVPRHTNVHHAFLLGKIPNPKEIKWVMKDVSLQMECDVHTRDMWWMRLTIQPNPDSVFEWRVNTRTGLVQCTSESRVVFELSPLVFRQSHFFLVIEEKQLECKIKTCEYANLWSR